MYITEMRHKTIKNHNNNVIMKFDNLAYVSGSCLSGLCLFLFEAFQVHHDSSKRLKKLAGHVLPDLMNPSKLTAPKSDERGSQKWPAKVHSSIASLHDNGFGSKIWQHKPIMNLPPWPQEGLVYIDMKLVTISQLPPNIWPKKGPNIPQ
jgi:hypothetical protein